MGSFESEDWMIAPWLARCQISTSSRNRRESQVNARRRIGGRCASAQEVARLSCVNRILRASSGGIAARSDGLPATMRRKAWTAADAEVGVAKLAESAAVPEGRMGCEAKPRLFRAAAIETPYS